MNFCCAAGNCSGCWSYWVHHHTVRSFAIPPRLEPDPIVNHDLGDEDDGMTYRNEVYGPGRKRD